MRIKLQSVGRAKAKWNVNNLKKPEIRKEYRVRLDKQIQEQNIDKGTNIDEIWKKLSECIEVVADEICGKEQLPRKQNWMTSEILKKMEERRLCKIRKDVGQYNKLKNEIRRMCREAEDRYHDEKCKEIEMLDIVHSQLLYQKIKDNQTKKKQNNTNY